MKKTSDGFLSRLDECRKGMSVSAFARHLGLNQKTVDLYIKGERKPSAELIIAVCSKCGVSADWLLGLTNNREPSASSHRLVRVETEHGAHYAAIVRSGEKTATPEGECVVIKRKTNPYGRHRTVMVGKKHAAGSETEAVPVSRKAFARLVRKVAHQQKTFDALTAKKPHPVI